MAALKDGHINDRHIDGWMDRHSTPFSEVCLFAKQTPLTTQTIIGTLKNKSVDHAAGWATSLSN